MVVVTRRKCVGKDKRGSSIVTRKGGLEDRETDMHPSYMKESVGTLTNTNTN